VTGFTKSSRYSYLFGKMVMDFVGYEMLGQYCVVFMSSIERMPGFWPEFVTGIRICFYCFINMLLRLMILGISNTALGQSAVNWT
jgi:hypothetical protein